MTDYHVLFSGQMVSVPISVSSFKSVDPGHIFVVGHDCACPYDVLPGSHCGGLIPDRMGLGGGGSGSLTNRRKVSSLAIRRTCYPRCEDAPLRAERGVLLPGC